MDANIKLIGYGRNGDQTLDVEDFQSVRIITPTGHIDIAPSDVYDGSIRISTSSQMVIKPYVSNVVYLINERH